MQVRVGISGQVIVDGKVDTLNIDTTTENIGGDTDTLVEFLELFVALDTGGSLVLNFVFCGQGYLPFFLANTRVHGDTGEVTLAQ